MSIIVYKRASDGSYVVPLQGNDAYPYELVDMLTASERESLKGFLDACGSRNLPGQNILDARAVRDVHPQFWATGVLLACASGNVDALKELVRAWGESEGARDARLPSLGAQLTVGLQLATRNGHGAVVQCMLDELRDVADFDWHANNNGALHEARENGHAGLRAKLFAYRSVLPDCKSCTEAAPQPPYGRAAAPSTAPEAGAAAAQQE